MVDESAVEDAAETAAQGAAEAAVAGGLAAEAEDAAARGRPRHARVGARPPDPRDGVAEGACANCGAASPGAYCASCGQAARSFHRPIWVIVIEALETLFALDGRFWRTAPQILFRPGEVTALYLAGARARFVQPFRLFLFTSVIFFVLANALAGDPRRLAPPDPSDVAASVEAGPADTQGAAPASGEAARAEAEGEAAEPGGTAVRLAEGASADQRLAAKCRLRALLTPERPRSRACDALAAAQDDAAASDGDEVVLDGVDITALGAPEFRARLADGIALAMDRPDAYVAALQRWAPRITIALFPVYALLVALLYVGRRDLYLYDHLVFSLHFHTFLFLALMLFYAAHVLVGALWAVLGFIVISNVGLYRMQRAAFGASGFGAGLRVVVLDVIYAVLLLLALSVALALGLMFL